MSDGGDANASNARTEEDQGTSHNAMPKTTPVLWADMSDGDDEDEEYGSAHRGSGGENASCTRPGTGGVTRPGGVKASGGARLDSRANSNTGGRGGSGQRQIGGQRSYGRGPILERRGSRNYALSGNPSNLVVQHGPGVSTQQRRQPGLQNRSGNSSTFSRNQSSTLSHASSPMARRGARPVVDTPPVDAGPPYRLYVAPLPMNVTHGQIRDAFTPLKLRQIEVAPSARNDKTVYAFIEMFTYDDMVTALNDLQNHVIGDHRISIKPQRRKEPPTSFKIARSVGQLSDKPSDRESERGITPPRTEGTLKGHKKALLCMLASDNDNTKRDTKIFGTGKPREEKWEEPPPAATESSPPLPPSGNPEAATKSPDSHKQTDLSHANPPPEQRPPPPPPPAEVPSFVAKSPPRQPADSGSDSMNSSNVQRTHPVPDAEDRHPLPRQQFRDVPHLMSMPPMAEISRHPDHPAFSPPPPADMMMNYGMIPKPYIAPAPNMIDMGSNQGFRYPPDAQQYSAVMAQQVPLSTPMLNPQRLPQMFWAPADEFSQPPMGPRMAPPPERQHHLPGPWTDVPYLGHALVPQPTQPVIMGGYDLMHVGPSVMRTQGLPVSHLEATQNATVSNSSYFESNGVRPPEEVVTMPMTYGAARGPSPRQGPEAMMAASSNPGALNYCRQPVIVPNPRGPCTATNSNNLKSASPPPPLPPPQPRFVEAPLPPQSHPAPATIANKVPSPPSSHPTASQPSQQQQQPTVSNKTRSDPPPAPNSRPSYASVVGADKKLRSSSSGVAPTNAEATPSVTPSVESSSLTRGGGSTRGGKGRGTRNQTRRNQQQQPNGGRVWMKQPSSSHEAETIATSESTRNKIGHSDSCSTDDFLEFAKGRKRS